METSICECGKRQVRPNYVLCDFCLEKKRLEKYKSLPLIEWDGVTPFLIFDSDEYFYSEEDLELYCDENAVTPEELNLVISEPIYARHIDTDIFEDEMAEDSELPEELEKAIKDFNAAIDAYGKPLSWTQGTSRVKF